MLQTTAPFRLCALAMAVLTASGCATQYRETNREAREAIAKTGDLIQQSAPKNQGHSGVHIHPNTPYLAGEKVAYVGSLPAALQQPISYLRNVPASLNEIANWVSSNAGIPTRVDPAINQGSKVPVVAPLPMGKAGDVDFVPPMPSFDTPPPNVSEGGVSALSAPAGALLAGPVSGINYKGSLSGFLDLVAEKFGVFWKYEAGAVSFFKEETKVYTIPTLAIKTSMTGSIAASGTASGGGTASQNSSSTTGMDKAHVLDYWKSIESQAKAIVGERGKLVADREGGTMVLTAPPQVQATFARWVDETQQKYLRQIGIEVEVYNVSDTSSEGYNLELNLASVIGSLGDATANIGFSNLGNPNVASLGNLAQVNSTIIRPNTRFTGSSIALRALSQLGRVSKVVSRTGVTVNGEMLALQAARNVGYLASSQTTITSAAGATTALTPGNVTVGFTGTFLPRSTVDDRIMLDINMSLSDLLSLVTFTSGGAGNQSSIQLPETINTTFQQMVALKSGETLILTGYRTSDAKGSTQGVGNARFYGLGGGFESDGTKNLIAVVITAKFL